MAFNGTGSLVFIDNIRADKSSRMNSEVYRDILSAQIQPNAVKLIGRRFIVQMDNDPKHTAKATQEFMSAKKWNILQWPSQSPDLNPIEHAFHLLKSRLKTERPTNKQDLKAAAVKAWQSIKKEETQRLVMSMGSRLKASKNEEPCQTYAYVSFTNFANDGNQGKHRVTKRGPALSYPMFTLVTSEDIAGSRKTDVLISWEAAAAVETDSQKIIQPSSKKLYISSVTNVDDEGTELGSGIMELTQTELVLHTRKRDAVRWPYLCLRRYGYDSNLFSFESGRRCQTGQGIFAFKCSRAEEIFNLLQELMQRNSISVVEEPVMITQELATQLKWKCPEHHRPLEVSLGYTGFPNGFHNFPRDGPSYPSAHHPSMGNLRAPICWGGFYTWHNNAR
ncbi:unnamed protein product [Ranitomeya imitator]|uniref:IRS-type PTB domain-containing protein n=1 Tax=Ranitomeya imitator TaxID=111125 RepID=A0ABN9MIJ8_9NEOB|nr:unnamed protein product [Ranitomeya imitator]